MHTRETKPVFRKRTIFYEMTTDHFFRILSKYNPFEHFPTFYKYRVTQKDVYP